MSRSQPDRTCPTRLPAWFGTGCLVLLGAWGSGCSADVAQPPHSVLLLTLDTTRFDAPGAFGGRAGVSPNLDALALEGIAYLEARSVAPLTMPAHASILTGLYPPRHGVRDNNVEPLSDDALTIGEAARAAGYDTAAFVSSIAVDSAFGFAQGFDLYDEPGRASQRVLSHAGARSAEETVAAARAWLAQRDGKRPFLLWVHLYDPHAPYEPAPEFQAQASGNAYLGEVAAMDAAVGVLLQELKEGGFWANTLVCVVADHGEGLGNHDEATHGTYCYGATIRVPLLIRHPNGWRRGESSDEVVSVADVAPTLFDAMGVRAPDGLDGQSLFRRKVAPERGVYFESFYGYLYHGWSPLVGWADRGGTYLHSSVPLFFAPGKKNGKGRRVKPRERSRVAPYVRSIRELYTRPSVARATAGHAALAQELRALGYAAAADVSGSLPDPFETDHLPSPHARKDEHVRTLRALNLAKSDLNDQAIRLLEVLVRENPANVVGLGRLADCYVFAGDWQKAVAALERTLERGPRAPGVFVNLGIALANLGQNERAEQSLRAALTADPDHLQALLFLEQLVERRAEQGELARLRHEIDRVRSERASTSAAPE